MSDPKKERGYFEKCLAIDCETSGLFFSKDSDDPSTNLKTGETYQAVSWGLIVADANTLRPIEKLYVEIKWNGTSLWEPKAEAVHGLSKQYLEENGVSEEEAVITIASFILKHFGPENALHPLGHNVQFDIRFLRQLMRKFGVELKFGNRILDSYSIGAVTFGTYNSDHLFNACGLPERKLHNALEDIEYTLESCRRIKMIFKAGLGEE